MDGNDKCDPVPLEGKEKSDSQAIQPFFQHSGATLHGWRVFVRPLSSLDEELNDLRELIEMEMRDDDVLLAAFQKSGTHWIWEVIKMLRKGETSIEERTKAFARIDRRPIGVLNKEPSPRTLNSHRPFCHLPKQIKEKKIKIVHVIRNPKDVVVSYYHHRKRRFTDMTLADFVSHTIANDCIHTHQFDFLRQMQKYQQDNPEVPAFNMFYEDMNKDPVKITRDLAQFLGVDVTEEFCKDVAEACSFDNMKAANPQRKQARGGLNTLYRKGHVGDWKNHLTVAMNESMDAFIERESKGLNYSFTYEI